MLSVLQHCCTGIVSLYRETGVAVGPVRSLTPGFGNANPHTSVIFVDSIKQIQQLLQGALVCANHPSPLLADVHPGRCIS